MSRRLTAYQLAQRIKLQEEIHTPKAISKSISIHSPVIQASSLYSLPDKPRRHKELSSTLKRISSPNRDIEKRITFSGIFDLSPSRQVCRQSQRSRPGCCQSFHTYTCKILFPTIRLTLL
ncbi:hypothetical protein AVEN_217587-1 [Araneus ventricosus]|uniref:Uncharacterized protein n=1 Tax=Araneus ventricosus TaxID=182803 RepID=A0A4Y2W4D8_ARAVE|nr:hypothetical protein AVEN_217587-1 [Araneus ventricosus]